jgi:tRNA-specific 2-thiouridylase
MVMGKKAADEKKDQSYFLWSIKKELLPRIHFPLGELTKPEVRDIAAKNGFSNAHRSDSQDICFIPDGDYVKFITWRDGNMPEGNFVDTDGNVLGKHKGIMNYTIGQRKGLGCAFGEKMYVKGKNTSANEVILAKNEELFGGSLDAGSFNWISFDNPPDKLAASAKIRYSAKEAPCTVYATGENSVHIEFDAPQRAIAKGQSVVLYDGDYVVGGGVIL